MLLIRWADTNIFHGWEHPETTQDSLAFAQAIGYLKSENGEQITLTMAVSDFGLVFERLTIPKGSIKSIKELRIK